MDATDAFDGKYAKNLGCCQWVIAFGTIFSKSLKINSGSSASSGGASGNSDAIDPGSIFGLTGLSFRFRR